MSNRQPSRADIEAFLHVDPERGILDWKYREPEEFASDDAWRIFNNRLAGGPALTTKRGGYYWGKINGRDCAAQQVIYFVAHGEWLPVKDIRHLDGNGFNNRIANLEKKTPRIMPAGEDKSGNAKRRYREPTPQIRLNLFERTGCRSRSIPRCPRRRLRCHGPYKAVGLSGADIAG